MSIAFHCYHLALLALHFNNGIVSYTYRHIYDIRIYICYLTNYMLYYYVYMCVYYTMSLLVIGRSSSASGCATLSSACHLRASYELGEGDGASTYIQKHTYIYHVISLICTCIHICKYSFIILAAYVYDICLYISLQII